MIDGGANLRAARLHIREAELKSSDRGGDQPAPTRGVGRRAAMMAVGARSCYWSSAR